MTKMNTDILPKEGLILCAVSGGADSMYLLCRLPELGYRVAAAHFNHGLRGAEADRDEAFVRDFCRERDIPFTAGRGDVAAFAADCRLGTEEAARRMRYEFLEREADSLGAAVIATAHTADDNAETVLMHLARGTGLCGLCGIPPVRGRVVRPMLDTSRETVEAYLRENGVGHVEDSTNAGDGYERNRIRHTAIPALRAENPALLEAVSRMTLLLRRDEEYLSGLARDFVRENAENGSLPAKKLLTLPEPVMCRAVRLMAGRELSALHTEAILSVAARGGFADVRGMRVGLAGDRLVFGVPEPRELSERTIFPGQELSLEEAGLFVRCENLAACPKDVYKSFNTFYFKYANICGSITITARKPGDRFRPAGRGCTKTLKALFAENGVASWRRGVVPVLRDEAGILGVFGVGGAERVCARPGDANVLKIEFSLSEQEKGGRGLA